MPLAPGQVLENRYRIVKLLGQGGFGAVYRAWDLKLSGPCAVKENLETSPAAQSQFTREASLLFNLKHASLPKVFDSFSIPGQGQYLVMEYIEGEDLESMLVRTGGPLPEGQVLPWILQVCDALSYLHSQQQPIIHRDIKPANIRITPQGQAILVDFGIAKVFDPQLKTTVGARAYTSGYSPPEQYGRGTTDAQSDIYSLGATFYALLTGQVPPDSVDIMTQAVPTPPSAHRINPSVSQQVSVAIQSAMRVERTARFKSVEEFKRALTLTPAPSPFQGEGPQTTVLAQTAPSPPAQPAQITPAAASRRVPWGWISIAGALLLAVVVLLTLVLDGGGSERSATLPAAVAAATITSPLTSTQTPKAGDTWQRPIDNMVMVYVPAGPFEMGSESGDADEKPVHTVTLDAFWIDEHEVTNAMYALCVQDGKCDPPSGSYYANYEYADNPVVYVTWYDTLNYCEWAGARLPTEAEWEKATRSGLEGKSYPWGVESPVCTLAAKSGAQYKSCVGQTAAVKSFAPNGYGLYDMAGNVWEWVSSLYKQYPYRSDDGRELNVIGSRVMRGGSWDTYEYSLRVANRDRNDPGNDYVNVGFRCARSP